MSKSILITKNWFNGSIYNILIIILILFPIFSSSFNNETLKFVFKESTFELAYNSTNGKMKCTDHSYFEEMDNITSKNLRNFNSINQSVYNTISDCVNRRHPTREVMEQFKISPSIAYNFSDVKCFNNNWYEYISTYLSWYDAKTYCESLGGHLVTLTSEEENNFVNTLVEDTIWIGFTDEQVEGEWQWVTQESVIYTNWDEGEPNDAGGEDYAEMYTSGKWNDIPGDSQRFHPFVCEWEDFIFPDPTMSPFVIENNLDFIEIANISNWLGNGTTSNPYLIQNQIIRGYFNDYAINISNTNLHFRIQNCTIIGGPTGIIFTNVTNGYIEDSKFFNQNIGICFNESYNCRIFNNSFSSYYYYYNRGIELYRSQNNSILNNILNNSALYLIFSGNNTISSNKHINAGLIIFGWTLEYFIQAKVEGNTVNDLPILFWQNQNSGSILSDFGQLILVNCSNILVENQNLSRTDSGLFATFSSNLLIQNNLFSENINEGLWIWKCKNVTISNNTIMNNNYSGIGIYFSNRTLISGNVIANNNDSGIFVYTSQMSTLSENNISDTNWIGIDLLLSESCLISGNTLINVADTGISIWNSSMSTILNNSVYNTGWSGIRLENSSSSILKVNKVINSSTISIELYSSCLCNLSLNKVNNSKDHAIHLKDSDNSTLVQNHIFDPELRGILLVSSDNCTLTENTLLKCSESITIEDSKNGFLLGNIIANASSVGIEIYSSEKTLLLKNTLLKCLKGVVLRDSGFSALSRNFISNISRNGFFLVKSGTSRIQYNTILNCGESGIFLGDSGNNWVSDNVVDRGFEIEGFYLSDYTQTKIENNTLENGKLIIFWQNTSGLTTNKTTIISPIGQILLVNCESIDIIDQNFTKVSTCILLAYCRDIKIYHNSLSKSDRGIFLTYSWLIKISSNNITETAIDGIEIRNGGNCSISDNRIYTTSGGLFYFQWWGYYFWSWHDGEGISISDSKFNIISTNIIFNTNGNGIALTSSENTLISGNNILKCQRWGINLRGSSFSTLIENSITNNSSGIRIDASSNCSIRSNLLALNEGYGVSLESDTLFISTMENDFLENNQIDQESSQANDDGITNIFIGNYWDDWTMPDRNRDGIVDYPYQIDGKANNYDYYPLARSINTPRKDYLPLNVIIGVPILFLIIGAISLLEIKKRKKI